MFCFQILLKCVWDASILWVLFLIMSIDMFRGGLTDMSAITKTRVKVSKTYLNLIMYTRTLAVRRSLQRSLIQIIKLTRHFDIDHIVLYETVTPYPTTSKHLNPFQYSEPCGVAIRYPMVDPKGGLRLLCSCQPWDIFSLHAVVLDLALRQRWKAWVFESLAVIWFAQGGHRLCCTGRTTQQPVMLCLKLKHFCLGYFDPINNILHVSLF